MYNIQRCITNCYQNLHMILRCCE